MKLSGGLQLKGSTTIRDLDLYPRDDDALGMKLFGLVSGALSKGRPAPAVFLFSESVIDKFAYRSFADHPPQVRRRILGALAGQDHIECLAMIGSLRFRGKGPLNGSWVASVFIEWPDNRWWTAWQPIGPRGGLVGDEPQIRTAIDGSPRPGGLGGWFALARRTGLRLRVHRDSVPVH